MDDGLAKLIGVSNFSEAQIDGVLGHARIPPAVNQVELHPLLAQRRLVGYCMRKVQACRQLPGCGMPSSRMSNLESGRAVWGWVALAASAAQDVWVPAYAASCYGCDMMRFVAYFSCMRRRLLNDSHASALTPCLLPSTMGCPLDSRRACQQLS